jgi:hypothetical protein
MRLFEMSGVFAMEFDDFLNRHVRPSVQHTSFYHFTDRKNLPSIREHGLLSSKALREKKIFDHAITGGDANSLISDVQNGTDGFVPLCFTRNHPMAHAAANDERQRDFEYLQIKPEIIKLAGVKIAKAASNQAGVVPHLAKSALGELDLEIIYTRTDWKNPILKNRLDIAEKYEILVPDSVPLQWITNL